MSKFGRLDVVVLANENQGINNVKQDYLVSNKHY